MVLLADMATATCALSHVHIGLVYLFCGWISAPARKSRQHSGRFMQGELCAYLQLPRASAHPVELSGWVDEQRRPRGGGLPVHVRHADLPVAYQSAASHHADYLAATGGDRVICAYRMGTGLIYLEADDAAAALLVMLYDGLAADEKRLVGPDESAVAGYSRGYLPRPGQLVTVQRQTDLDAG